MMRGTARQAAASQHSPRSALLIDGRRLTRPPAAPTNAAGRKNNAAPDTADQSKQQAGRAAAPADTTDQSVQGRRRRHAGSLVTDNGRKRGL